LFEWKVYGYDWFVDFGECLWVVGFLLEDEEVFVVGFMDDVLCVIESMCLFDGVLL